jgi:hypothetical protein
LFRVGAEAGYGQMVKNLTKSSNLNFDMSARRVTEKKIKFFYSLVLTSSKLIYKYEEIDVFI